MEKTLALILINISEGGYLLLGNQAVMYFVKNETQDQTRLERALNFKTLSDSIARDNILLIYEYVLKSPTLLRELFLLPADIYGHPYHWCR